MTGWSYGQDLHVEVVEVLIPVEGPPDDDGVPTTRDLIHPWPSCSVQQAGSAEDMAGREAVTTRIKISGPIAEWITSGCRIRWRGTEYRIDGDPAHYRTVIPHTEVTAVTWKGV